MTISAREADTSTTAIQSNFGSASSLAHTPFPSSMHGRSVVDAPSFARWIWTSGSDADARRSEVIDWVRRLSWRLLGSGAGNMSFLPVSADSGIFPPDVVRFTEEMREEGFPASSDMALWGVHRQLHAVGTDSSAFPMKTLNFTALAGDLCPDLCDALHDLDEARDEAREEGFPAPTDTALENARRLLLAMYGLLPCRFEVYPTPDGEIAVHSPAGSGRSVLVLCGSDGGVLCLVNMNGAHRRARYSDAGPLPDGFVREALAELRRRGEQAE